MMLDKMILRPITENDLERIRVWLQESEIVESIQSRTVTSAEQQEWYRRYLLDQTKKVFAIEVDQRHVGNISLFNIDTVSQRAMLTIFIGESNFRNNGLGSRALKALFEKAGHELGLRWISLEVLADNWRAIRCYEKVGMKKTDVLKKHVKVHGQLKDMVKMSIDLDQLAT